ncbi:hypothetical protein BGZ94_004098 [Podila epigama]|nr:hypothetical protein BGZ94_004098 [Podila epigama]
MTKASPATSAGYIGGTFLERWKYDENWRDDFKVRVLVRNSAHAEKELRPMHVEPVIGSLEDSDLLTREDADADVVLNFADADHLPAIKALLKGLTAPRKEGAVRKRPILIHTSGISSLADDAYGDYKSDVIYYDNDPAQLATLGIDRPHRKVDFEVLDPSLKGKVDTYIVSPPLIYSIGLGTGNEHPVQIPFMIKCSYDYGTALQVEKGLNVWSKVDIFDLADFYILLLERALKEPQEDGKVHVDENGNAIPELPKNADGYWFVEDGEIDMNQIARWIATEFIELDVYRYDLIAETTREEESSLWDRDVRVGPLLGSNARCRAVKAREFLGWKPSHGHLEGYVVSRVWKIVNGKP